MQRRQKYPYIIFFYTLWLYKLILKHLLNYCTKLHYIDFVWPLTPSSLMDIWYLVSNKQVICQKSWEMASRKNVRFLWLAQIDPFSDEGFKKKYLIFLLIKGSIHILLNSKHTSTVDIYHCIHLLPFKPIINTFLCQTFLFFQKFVHQK